MSGTYGSLRRILGLGTGENALPKALVEAQVRAARGGYPATFVATIFAAGTVIVTAPDAWRVHLSGAFLLLVSLWSLKRWHDDRQAGWVFDDPRGAILSTARLSFLTALAWGILLAMVMEHSGRDEQLLVACVIVGVMSVGALTAVAVPLASLTFLAGSLIGAALTIAVADLQRPILPVLSVFVFLLGRSILIQARLFIDNFQTQNDLETAEQAKALAEDVAQAARDRATLVEETARQAQRERAIDGR